MEPAVESSKVYHSLPVKKIHSLTVFAAGSRPTEKGALQAALLAALLVAKRTTSVYCGIQWFIHAVLGCYMVDLGWIKYSEV